MNFGSQIVDKETETDDELSIDIIYTFSEYLLGWMQFIHFYSFSFIIFADTYKIVKHQSKKKK